MQSCVFLFSGRMEGLLQITGGWVVQQLSFFRKTGTMAGAVPGMLLGVPLQCASKVRTTGLGGGQQILYGFCGIDKELWPPNRSCR